MKRVRHVAITAHRGGKQIREDEQQAIPIYDAITQALHKRDILGVAKYDVLAYEDTVVWLLQRLPEAHDFHSVESLLFQAFAEQQDLNQLDAAGVLRLQALAADISACWNQYRHRHEPSALTQQTYARSRMRRFLLPQ
jgi:hypothetical protein